MGGTVSGERTQGETSGPCSVGQTSMGRSTVGVRGNSRTVDLLMLVSITCSPGRPCFCASSCTQGTASGPRDFFRVSLTLVSPVLVCRPCSRQAQKQKAGLAAAAASTSPSQLQQAQTALRVAEVLKVLCAAL